MTEENKTLPVTEGALVEDLAFAEGPALPESVQKLVWPAITALLAVCALVFFIVNKRQASEETINAASLSLAKVQNNDVAALQQVVSNFPNTPSAPVALLTLAQSHYHLGNYEGAEASYTRFSAEYAGHEFAPVAVLGLIHCQEARGGQEEAALSAYRSFIATYAAHTYLTPQATFGAARCLIALTKLDEARVVYDDFVAGQDEDSSWTYLAEEYLERLDVKSKRAKGQL